MIPKYIRWFLNFAVVVFLISFAITYYDKDTPHFARFGILLGLALISIFSLSYFDFFKIGETLE